MTGKLFLMYVGENFFSKETIAMAVKTKISLEKISALKKRLQKLTAKDTGKSREEALEMLAEYFQNALRKRYSLKELRQISREEGVTVTLSKYIDTHPGD